MTAQTLSIAKQEAIKVIASTLEKDEVVLLAMDLLKLCLSPATGETTATPVTATPSASTLAPTLAPAGTPLSVAINKEIAALQAVEICSAFVDSNNEAVSQDNVRARAAAIIDFAKAAVGVAKCSAAGEATVVQKAAETGETTQEVCLRSQGLRGVTLVNGRQVEFRVKSAACTYSKEYKNWSYRESLQAFGDENVVNGEYYRYVRDNGSIYLKWGKEIVYQ